MIRFCCCGCGRYNFFYPLVETRNNFVAAVTSQSDVYATHFFVRSFCDLRGTFGPEIVSTVSMEKSRCERHERQPTVQARVGIARAAGEPWIPPARSGRGWVICSVACSAGCPSKRQQQQATRVQNQNNALTLLFYLQIPANQL